MPVDAGERVRLQRFNATPVHHLLFLLRFDTRVGSGDTGPYDVGELGMGPAGPTMIVRDLYRLGRSGFWFWWSDPSGVADEFDWSVPRDVQPPLWDLLVATGRELGSSVVGGEAPEDCHGPLA